MKGAGTPFHPLPHHPGGLRARVGLQVLSLPCGPRSGIQGSPHCPRTYSRARTGKRAFRTGLRVPAGPSKLPIPHQESSSAERKD